MIGRALKAPTYSPRRAVPNALSRGSLTFDSKPRATRGEYPATISASDTRDSGPFLWAYSHANRLLRGDEEYARKSIRARQRTSRRRASATGDRGGAEAVASTPHARDNDTAFATPDLHRRPSWETPRRISTTYRFPWDPGTSLSAAPSPCCYGWQAYTHGIQAMRVS